MINELRKVQDALKKLSFILNKEQKIYCVIVFILSLVAALFETLGVSVIIPIIQMVVSIEELMKQPYMVPLIEIFNLESSNEVIIFICIGIGFIYVIKNAYSVFYTWVSAKFSNKIRRELSVGILETYMQQGYIFFVENNSSKLIRGISGDVISVQNVISNFFSFICKVLIIFCMTLFVVIQNPIMAFGIFCLLVFCFVISQVVFRRPMRKYGRDSREYAIRSDKASLEAIHGNKEVLVFGRQKYFVDEYLKQTVGYNNAEVQKAVASTAPTYLIEVICIIGLLCVVAVQSVASGGSSDLLTQMATIAIAAFRILPALGILLGNVNAVVFNAPGLTGVYNTLNLVGKIENRPGTKVMPGDKVLVKKEHLENELELSNISYAYPRTRKNVIDGLSMKISKGTSIGLIGASGAGKTTLADIILGLLKPQTGEVLIDGINIEKLGGMWNQIIGYVPQVTYMVDASVRRNVAFGINEEMIDEKRVWKALEMAQMKEFVESLPYGVETRVGERGVQLSGGQRQRIAIARALYSDPDIIVLDEATAALDNETETAVMEAIEALQKVKTLIIVAHRLTTIRKCDVVFEVADGKAILRDKSDILSEEVKQN